jgi:hypothetical protein
MLFRRKGFTTKRRRSFSNLFLESLEHRWMPNSVTWTGAASSAWNTAGIWSGLSTGETKPSAADDVTIPVSPKNNPAITVSNANVVHSLIDNAPLSITTGSLTDNGAGTMAATGAISVTGGTLTFSGILTSSGSMTVSGGTVVFAAGSAGSTVGAEIVSSGILTVKGALTVNGQLSFTGGTIKGPAQMSANGGIALDTTNTPTIDGGNLVNNGTAVWTGSGYLYMIDGGAWNNATAGSVLDAQRDALLYYDGTGAMPTFANAGTFEKSQGNGTTRVFPGITNTGTISVLSGTIELDGGGNNSGTFSEAASTSLTVPSGTVTFQSGVSSGAGTLALDGGTLTTTAGGTVQNLAFSSGTLQGTGSWTVTGAGLLTWTGGTMTGAGQTVVNGSIALDTSSAATLLDGRTLVNNGSAVWTGANYLQMDDGAVWNIGPNGVLDAQSDARFYDNGTGSMPAHSRSPRAAAAPPRSMLR